MKFIAIHADFNLEIPSCKVRAVEAIEGEAVGEGRIIFQIRPDATAAIAYIIDREMAALMASIATSVNDELPPVETQNYEPGGGRLG